MSRQAQSPSVANGAGRSHRAQLWKIYCVHSNFRKFTAALDARLESSLAVREAQAVMNTLDAGYDPSVVSSRDYIVSENQRRCHR